MEAVVFAIGVACAVQTCAIFLLIRSYRAAPLLTPSSVTTTSALPFVSVIVPARDEELNIEGCVESIAAQEYPTFEIVVIDDQSTDATPAILGRLAAAHPELRLVAGADLPAGWAGKPHALAQGVRHAKGELLLFVDADVRLHPACVQSAVSRLEETRADLLTLFPRVVTESFWERVIQPAIVQLIAAVFRPDRINDPRDSAASANGPFLLFRRTAYERIGGHTAVRGEIVEDLVLARLVKTSGLRLLYCLGPELVSLRMYRSLSEIWNGWSKNFYTGAGGSIPAAISGAAAIFIFLVLPWMLVPIAIFAVPQGGALGAAAAAAVVGLFAAAAERRRQLARRYGVDMRLWYLEPAGFLIAAAILVNSTVLAFGRGTRWRGRPTPVRSRASRRGV